MKTRILSAAHSDFFTASYGCGADRDWRGADRSSRRRSEPGPEGFFTTKSPGRGLGLPVVDGIVRRLGGEIIVRSQPNQGTSLQILLPEVGKSPAERLDPFATAGKNRRRARATVLVVEDEEGMRTAVSKMLQKHGFTVLEATDGSAALEMLRMHADDTTVMLLDVTLDRKSTRL